MLDLWAPHVPWILALLVMVVLVCRLASILVNARARERVRTGAPRLLASDESATAVLEFVLVLPVFTMVVLIVIQLALLVRAHLVVSYAAYTSCRTAIVWISEGLTVARNRAACSAELALMVISPPEPGSGAGLEEQLAPLFAHGNSGASTRDRLTRAAAKIRYADRETHLTLLCPVALGPHTPITSQVDHRFRLDVPYAGGLLAGLFGSGSSTREPSIWLTDSFTLLHEGRVEYEHLPDRQRRPRVSFAGSLPRGEAWR